MGENFWGQPVNAEQILLLVGTSVKRLPRHLKE